MATLQEVLGAKNLCGVIQAVKPGLPADLLPGGFLTPNRSIEGNFGTYRKVWGNRQLARKAQYGSASKVRNLKGIAEVPVTLIHALESINHNPAVLQNLQQIDNEAKQRFGQQEIARETKNFKDLFANLRVASVFSLLAYGKIFFDAEGNVVTTAAAATEIVDFQIPETNRNQCAWDGKTPIFNASWATTSTKILLQMKALKRAARQLTGYPLKYAFYGANIFSYLLNNTEIQTYMKHNPGFQEALVKNEIPPGFMGLDWFPMDEAFYATPDEKTHTFFGEDSITFTPEPSVDWFEFIEGSYPVPGSIDFGRDAEELVGQILQAQGMFSYADILHDPVTIKQVAGDTFLPAWKVPQAGFFATVKF